jgi:hypothetical protein
MQIARRLAALALGLGLALGIVSSAQAQQATAPADPPTFTLWPKWGPYLDVGGLIGTQRNIGGADLFIPVWQNESAMLFGDFRVRADDQTAVEGNFGAGFRHMLGGGWTPGIYGYYDHRKASTGTLFDQLTFGAELLGTNFDFRANYYAPVGQTQQLQATISMGPPTAQVVGSSLLVTEPGTLATYAYALRGFDAEAGVRIPITSAESPYVTRFYAGAYRFDEPTGVVPVVAGPRLRLEFTDYDFHMWAGSRFTAEVEWQTDQVRGSQFFGGLRLRIPLQAAPSRALAMQERRMTDPIVRDVDIVAQSATIQQTPTIVEPATSTASGLAITGISSASTSGAALPGAVAAAGANSFVALQGNFTTNPNGTGVVTLNPGQTLMGGGAVALRTASGRTVTAMLPGASITGNVSAANHTVVMANNSTLTGLTINNTSAGANAQAVLASGVTGVTISNNVINVTDVGGFGTAHGIDVVTGANAMVTGNTVTSPPVAPYSRWASRSMARRRRSATMS